MTDFVPGKPLPGRAGFVGKFLQENWLILMIFLVGLLLRLLGSVRTYFAFDEKLWMQAAQKVSFSPSTFHLPLHGVFHPFFEVYLIKFSSLMLPRFLIDFIAPYQFERLQMRFLHVLLSTGAILAIYLLAKEGFGKRAAVFSAALVASCQFHIHFSRTVIQTAPLLFFVTISLYLFWKSIKENRAKHILLTGVSLGFAYLCEETAAFLLLIFFIYLLLSRKLSLWLKSPQTYIALAIFFVIISPDIFWNLSSNSSDITFHLSRAARFKGISLLPSSLFIGELLLMFPKDPVAFIGGFGRHAIWTMAYPTLHWVLGIFCILAVVLSLRRWKDPFTRLMLISFSVVFLFFTFAASAGFARNYNFWWASIIFIPAIVLAGELFSRLFEKGTPGKILSLLAAAYLFAHALLFLEIRDPVYVRRPYFLARYYLNNGKSSLLQGNAASARQDFEKALRFEKSFVPALVNMAECYRRQGNLERAQDLLQRVYKSGISPSGIDHLVLDTGYIRAWTIGPAYQLSDANRASEAEHVLDEVLLNRDTHRAIVPFASQSIQSPSAFIDLKKMLGNGSNICSLARTRIYAPLHKKVTFLVGADDGMTMCLNGERIYRDHKKNLWFPDEDTISAELNQGWNDLVLCVSYGSGSQYGFTIRLLDENGSLVDDLKFETPHI
jgi:tetratricopeptide (TPR) repeat protein